MPRITIEFVTSDRMLAFDLLNAEKAGIGQKANIPGGATIECTEWTFHKAFGVPEFLSFIIDASVAIEVNLVSNWLYEKVKSHKIERMTLNRREVVDFTENGIRCVLEETITQEKS